MRRSWGEEEKDLELTHNNYRYMAQKMIENLGGKQNILINDNCMTRLRMEIKDMKAVNHSKIKQMGVHGIVEVDDHNLQIIIGSQAAIVKKEMDDILDS